MFGITLKRIFKVVVAAAIVYVLLQYVPALFYALEFDDFVKDEVKFAPLREHAEEGHLVGHILQEASFYGMVLDRQNISVTIVPDKERGIRTLTVDIHYKMPVDLYYFTHDVPFHLHETTFY